jgi:hypothetical protein
MTGLPSSRKKEKVSLVPLESELKDSRRRKEVLDKLDSFFRHVSQSIASGLSEKQFVARDSLRKAITMAISVVKNYRG